MKRKIQIRSSFKKDLKRIKKAGLDMNKLFTVVEKLANDEILEENYRNHKLAGNYTGCRECHIEPDWLLIYEKIGTSLILILNRTGSHSDLF